MQSSGTGKAIVHPQNSSRPKQSAKLPVNADLSDGRAVEQESVASIRNTSTPETIHQPPDARGQVTPASILPTDPDTNPPSEGRGRAGSGIKAETIVSDRNGTGATVGLILNQSAEIPNDSSVPQQQMPPRSLVNQGSIQGSVLSNASIPDAEKSAPQGYSGGRIETPGNSGASESIAPVVGSASVHDDADETNMAGQLIPMQAGTDGAALGSSADRLMQLNQSFPRLATLDADNSTGDPQNRVLGTGDPIREISASIPELMNLSTWVFQHATDSGAPQGADAGTLHAVDPGARAADAGTLHVVDPGARAADAGTLHVVDPSTRDADEGARAVMPATKTDQGTSPAAISSRVAGHTAGLAAGTTPIAQTPSVTHSTTADAGASAAMPAGAGGQDTEVETATSKSATHADTSDTGVKGNAQPASVTRETPAHGAESTGQTGQDPQADRPHTATIAATGADPHMVQSEVQLTAIADPRPSSPSIPMTQRNSDGIAEASHASALSDIPPSNHSEFVEGMAGSGINSARLVQAMTGTEMHIGLHSSEFGEISIRTSISPQQLVAQISLDHGELSNALSAQVSNTQAKLGNESGLQSVIEINNQGSPLSGGSEHSPEGKPGWHSGEGQTAGTSGPAENEQGSNLVAALTAGNGHSLDIRA